MQAKQEEIVKILARHKETMVKYENLKKAFAVEQDKVECFRQIQQQLADQYRGGNGDNKIIISHETINNAFDKIK